MWDWHPADHELITIGGGQQSREWMSFVKTALSRGGGLAPSPIRNLHARHRPRYPMYRSQGARSPHLSALLQLGVSAEHERTAVRMLNDCRDGPQ